MQDAVSEQWHFVYGYGIPVYGKDGALYCRIFDEVSLFHTYERDSDHLFRIT